MLFPRGLLLCLSAYYGLSLPVKLVFIREFWSSLTCMVYGIPALAIPNFLNVLGDTCKSASGAPSSTCAYDNSQACLCAAGDPCCTLNTLLLTLSPISSSESPFRTEGDPLPFAMLPCILLMAFRISLSIILSNLGPYLALKAAFTCLTSDFC